MKILHILALVAVSLVSSVAHARPPMETNQLVDDTGTPIGTVANPLVTSGGSGGGGGSVTAAGTSGTQAQSVQGINGGVPVTSTLFQNGSAVAVGNPLFTQIYQNGSAIGASNPLSQTTASTAQAVGPVPAMATGPALLAKASPGNLYGFSVTAGATAGFLALLNVTAAPAAGASIAPFECIPVAANQYYGRRQDIPDRYTVGIAAVFSSSCTTYTAVAPQVVSLVVQ